MKIDIIGLYVYMKFKYLHDVVYIVECYVNEHFYIQRCSQKSEKGIFCLNSRICQRYFIVGI